MISARQPHHQNQPVIIAIIGGGASGVIAAIQLIRHSRARLEIVFIEPRANLLLHSGRIAEASVANDSRFRVRVALRGGRDDLSLEVARILNCTGPSSNLHDSPPPLIQNLLESQIARTDSLALGLLTDEDGALLGPSGAASNVLFTLGPMRRGTLLESSAIPEIRVQAAVLARRLLAGLSPASVRHEISYPTDLLAVAGD